VKSYVIDSVQGPSLQSSEELAHNGLASARQEGRVPRPLVPGLRGLCALVDFRDPFTGNADPNRDKRADHRLLHHDRHPARNHLYGQQ
jgi:hypothetical protein